MRKLKQGFLKIILRVFNLLASLHQAEKYRHFRLTYNLDETFRFNGIQIIFSGKGEITISKNTYLGSYSTIQAEAGHKVVIGEGCAISSNVRIFTQTYIPDQDFALSRNESGGNVLIGDNVWIGANVVVNPGVRIGSNAIIGANSVVTKSVEADSIYGGVPARLIRHKNI